MRVSKIILADDHEIIRLGLVKILKDEFPLAEITEVADGASLVKEITFNDYDLVISDLDMPNKTGLEALEDIKRIKPGLPVVILSIYPESVYAIRILKAGGSAYLTKNLAQEELIKAIRQISTGKKYITQAIIEKLVDTKFDKKPHELLSNREFEIFKLFAIGKTTGEIANAISLAPSTVSTVRSRILEKLQCSSNAELTRYAITQHIINDLEIW